MYSGSQNRMRMRIFNVLDDVKRDHGFAPVVTRPAGVLHFPGSLQFGFRLGVAFLLQGLLTTMVTYVFQQGKQAPGMRQSV